jgi:hypothetical protein
MCGATNIKELSFEAERDIGQGKSASNLQWTSFYDMILMWTDSKIGSSTKMRICENRAI